MYGVFCLHVGLSTTCVADDAQGSQKGFQIPLELTLKVIVKHLIWALGTKLRSLGKANSAMNHKANE